MGVEFLRRLDSLLLVLLIMLAAVPARSQTANPPGVGFALVGIAVGQSAGVNVVNLAAPDTANASSCSVNLQFLDPQGAVLKQTTVNLMPGTASTLNLSYAELSSSNVRTEIRGVLRFGYVGGANPPQPIVQQTACAHLVPSLELYDNDTGRTSLILTDAKQLPQSATPVQ